MCYHASPEGFVRRWNAGFMWFHICQNPSLNPSVNDVQLPMPKTVKVNERPGLSRHCQQNPVSHLNFAWLERLRQFLVMLCIGERKGKLQANQSAATDMLPRTLGTCSKMDQSSQLLHCNHSGISLARHECHHVNLSPPTSVKHELCQIHFSNCS